MAAVPSPTRPVRTFKRGELIVHAGRTANASYVLRRGVVRCFLLDSDGRETTTAIVGRGQLVGLAPLIGRTVHREFVEALTHVDAWTLTPVELQREGPDTPGLHGLALGSLARRLELTLGVLKCVSLLRASDRLRDIQRRLPASVGPGCNTIRDSTLAALLQMRPETLARLKHTCLGPEEWRLSTRERWTAEPGRRAFGQGDVVLPHELPAGFVGHVLSGEVQVRLVNDAPRAIVAEMLQAGDLFSTGALMGLPPIGLEVVGTRPGAVEILQASDLLAWFQQHLAECGAMVMRLAHRLERLEDTLVRVSTPCLREHLMQVLREFAVDAPTRAGRGARVVPATWSHQQIAQHMGVRRESVTRGLSSLARAGLIRRDGRHILLVDRIQDGASPRSTHDEASARSTRDRRADRLDVEVPVVEPMLKQEWSVLERLRREQWSNVERVRAIERLAATGLGVREIGRRTGFSASTISRWLRVNRRAELKRALEDGCIDIARAVVLVQAPPAVLPVLLQVAPTLSVAELRRQVSGMRTERRVRPETEVRRHLREALQSLRAISFSPERDLLDSIRREVDRLALA